MSIKRLKITRKANDASSSVKSILNSLFDGEKIRNIRKDDKIDSSFSFKSSNGTSGTVKFKNVDSDFIVVDGKLHVISSSDLKSKFNNNNSEWVKSIKSKKANDSSLPIGESYIIRATDKEDGDSFFIGKNIPMGYDSAESEASAQVFSGKDFAIIEKGYGDRFDLEAIPTSKKSKGNDDENKFYVLHSNDEGGMIQVADLRHRDMPDMSFADNLLDDIIERLSVNGGEITREEINNELINMITEDSSILDGMIVYGEENVNDEIRDIIEEDDTLELKAYSADELIDELNSVPSYMMDKFYGIIERDVRRRGRDSEISEADLKAEISKLDKEIKVAIKEGDESKFIELSNKRNTQVRKLMKLQKKKANDSSILRNVIERAVRETELDEDLIHDFIYNQYGDMREEEIVEIFNIEENYEDLIDAINRRANEDFDNEADIEFEEGVERNEELKGHDSGELQYNVPFSEIQSLRFDTVELLGDSNVRFIRNRRDENSRYTMDIDLYEVLDDFYTHPDRDNFESEEEFVYHVAELIMQDLSEYSKNIHSMVFIETYLD